MCRGSDLGVCCAQGCDVKIRCRDSGGYCDGHDPFDLEREVPEVVDDPEKRRQYDLARMTEGIARAEMLIRSEQVRLAELRSRVASLRG